MLWALAAPDTWPLEHCLAERSGCVHGMSAAVMQAASLGRGGQGRAAPHLLLLCGAVETVLQGDYVGMTHHLHDLELPVLEALILQHLLNRHLHMPTWLSAPLC